MGPQKSLDETSSRLNPLRSRRRASLVTAKNLVPLSNGATSNKGNPVGGEYKQRRSYIALVLFTICFGSCLRIYNFWIPPIWVDEYGTWWVVAADTWLGVIERTLRIQGQSPLYYLIVKAVTEVGGYGAFQLRLPSIFFGILTLIIVYRLALRIFDDQYVSLIYLVLFALAEPFIWYSQIARPYAFALFFSLVSFWSFVCLQNAATIALRAVFILSSALTVYAHYLFGFILIIQALYLIVSGRTRLFSRFWTTNFASVAILSIPAAWHLIYLHDRRSALDWMASVDTSWRTASAIIYMIGGASPVAIIATGVVITMLGIDWQTFKPVDIRQKLTLPVIWYTVPLAGFLIVPNLLGITLIQPRYLLFGYPAAYLIFAWLITNVHASIHRKWLPAVVFVVTTILFISVPALKGTRTFARWPSRVWNDVLTELFQDYKYDGIIVAQLGLVEADLLADTGTDPELLSYLSWPLISSLPNLQQENIAVLPYRLTENTKLYLFSLVTRAAKHQKIWLVGGGDAFWAFQNQLVQRFGYQVVSRRQQTETFHLLVLTKAS
jgi:hypothetical protein